MQGLVSTVHNCRAWCWSEPKKTVTASVALMLHFKTHIPMLHWRCISKLIFQYWLMWCGGEGSAADEGLILLLPVLRKERVLCRMLKLDSDSPPDRKNCWQKRLEFWQAEIVGPSKKDRGRPRLLWIKVTSYCNVTKVKSGGSGAAASLRRASSHYHFLLYQQFSATTAQFIRKLQSKVAKLLFLSLREKDSACDFWDILPGAIRTF